MSKLIKKSDGYYWTEFLYKKYNKLDCIDDDDHIIDEVLFKEFVSKYKKKIALLKWDLIIQANGLEDISSADHPLLIKLLASCSYCYIYQKGFVCNKYTKCPLNVNYVRCESSDSVWKNWSTNRTKANAILMREHIVKYG